MSLYINNENQKLLWTVIHNNATAIQFFSRITEEKKIEWFKTIIRLFYENTATRNLTISDLQQLNKATISYMLQNINMSNVNEPNVNGPTVNVREPSSAISPRPQFTKEEILHHQFDNKKKEYEQMFERKAPDNIDFREKIEDGAINNMSDLVQSHIREREEELRKYSQQAPNILPQQIEKTHQKLKIDNNDSINITTEVLEIEEKRQKKTVTFKEEESKGDTFLMLFEEFESFKLTVNKKLEELQRQIQELQSASLNLQI
jgi:hypothetical protein